MFFSEEKNQKTFDSGACEEIRDLEGEFSSAEDIKVFCFFSSEKKCFLNLP